MSTTLFIITLAAGGLAIGALCGLLLPRARTGGLPKAILICAGLSVFAGVLLTELFEAEQGVGFAGLALGPFWAFGKGGGSAWSGSGYATSDWGGGDCGDSGGGDGGGGCD